MEIIVVERRHDEGVVGRTPTLRDSDKHHDVNTRCIYICRLELSVAKCEGGVLDFAGGSERAEDGCSSSAMKNRMRVLDMMFEQLRRL